MCACKNLYDGFDGAVRRGPSCRSVLDSLCYPCVGEILKDQHAKAMHWCHTLSGAIGRCACSARAQIIETPAPLTTRSGGVYSKL